MGFFAALRFLSAIPLPQGRPADLEATGRSLGYFPLAGLALGLVLAGLDRALGLVLPPSVTSAFLVVTLVLLTGAMHLDGFADTCDGLAGGRTPEQRRQAMLDSRVGAFGAVGVVCLLLLKYSLLGELAGPSRTQVLALVPALARWAVVPCVLAFPSARPQGLGRVFKDQATRGGVLLATLVAAGLSFGLLRWKGLLVMACTGLAAAALAAVLCRRFNGLTGDVYGAIIEASEVGALLLIVLDLP